MSAPLKAEVEALERLDLEGLRAFWRKHYGAPPAIRSPDYLRLMLAWRLQATALGGIERGHRRQLAATGRLEPEGRSLGLGARLTREWQGQTVDVIVEEAGFRWRGTIYKSLSAAATAIAGTRWNGPRFFGLRA